MKQASIFGKRVKKMGSITNKSYISIIKGFIAAATAILILTAMLIVAPVKVNASGIIDAGDYVYQVLEDGKSVKIIQYKGQSLYVSLPAEVEDYQVTAVGAAAFMSNQTIKELDFSSSIAVIEENAFYKCTSLQKLQIPGNVLAIGDCAFMDCISLQSVTIYDGTEYIGAYAFSGCTALKELRLPNSLKAIQEFAFFNCSSLADAAIPRSVDEFGGHMLDGTKWMNEQKGEFIVIGDGVLIRYNGKEKSKSLPNSIKQIGEYAFAENNNIETILISDSVSKIGKYAFRNCKSLTTVRLPESLTEIGQGAFSGCESLDKVTLPKSISKIDIETFEDCTSLRAIAVPPTISSIGNEAFAGCKSLKDVSLQNGLQTIDSLAFADCTSLGRLILPESLKDMAPLCVIECPSLTRVEFNGDTAIHNCTFSDCPNLHEVVFYKNPTSIEDNSFYASRELKLYSDNSLYVEEYARKNKLGFDNIRNLDPYKDEGILKPEEKNDDSGFSGSYTLIVIIIIIVDLALIVLFSLYILFVQPKGRHSGKGKAAQHKYAKGSTQPVRQPKQGGGSPAPNRKQPGHKTNNK